MWGREGASRLTTQLYDTIGAEVEPILIPWDCMRRGVSLWAKVGPEVEQRVVRRLREDLASGRWAERNRELGSLDEVDLGLRLLVAC